MPFFPGRAAAWALFSVVLGLALFQGERVRSSTFQVTPTQVFLSGKTQSALVTVRNEATETLRFQLSVFAWDQSPKGEILLSPTDDIVFFPSLLTLAAGEERRVRVGAVRASTPSEKTYRIFVEELPPLRKPGEAEEVGQVRLLTKVGIPIFLQPDRRVVEGRVQEMQLRKRILSFEVKNSGTIHFVPQEIRVKGSGAGGALLFERSLEGWYILTGGSRVYELELPKKECTQIKTLAVEVQTGQMVLKEGLEALPGGCGE